MNKPTENAPSSGSKSKNLTPTQKNLHDIKASLENILAVTSESAIAQAKADPIDAANIARLHSYASSAYAQILTILAK